MPDSGLVLINNLSAKTGVIQAMDALSQWLFSLDIDFTAIDLSVETPFTPELNYNPDRHAFCGILSRRQRRDDDGSPPVARDHGLTWIMPALPNRADELKRHVETELAGSRMRSAAYRDLETAGRAMGLAIASRLPPVELTALCREESVAIKRAIADFLEALTYDVDISIQIRLTPREIDVLTLTASGRTRDESAALLKISPATVKDHLQRASLKLGANNKTHAVALAMQLGLIMP